MTSGTKARVAADIRLRRAGSPEEAAYLDLWRTTELLSRPFVELLKTADLSMSQYNVLRILRGAPEGLTCGEIADRMISRDPDITRLVDRLMTRSLVSRGRADRDRRIVLTRIAPAGLALLNRLDGPVQDTHRRLLGGLGTAGLRTLAKLLQECRRGIES